MVDEDDDDNFGDFTFAPPPPPSPSPPQQQNHTVHSNPTKINGPDLSMTTKTTNDDAWADFITTTAPTSSTALSHTLSLPKTTKPLDPSPVQPGSAPGRVGSRWEKPMGVLPLSIFGEVEEEEEEEGRGGVDSSRLFYNGDARVGLKSGGGGQKGVDLNDLIGSLYKQSKVENGSAPDSNGRGLDHHGSDLVGREGKKDLILERNSGWDQENVKSDLTGLDLGLNALNVSVNLSNSVGNGANVDSLGSKFGWNAMNFGPNGSPLSENVLNPVVKEATFIRNERVEDYGSDGDGDGGDDDGWEFQGSEVKINAGEDDLEVICCF